MIRGRGIIAGALIALFISLPLCAENALKPTLNLVPGDRYLCSMDMSQRIKQTIEGDEQMMEQNLLLVWQYEVLSKFDNGNYEISATYSRVKSSQRFGMQTVEFDSNNMPDYIDPSMIGYKLLIGSKLSLEVTPEGKVKSLEGFEEIVDKLIENLNIPDSPQRDQIISGLRSQFGDEAMRQSFEQMTSFYPDHAVNIGDDWHSVNSINLGFPIIVESDYKLLSVNEGIAEIDVNSNIRSDPTSSGIDMGQFTLTYNIEGAQDGSIEMDEKSGLPTRSDIQQSFSGTVSVSEAPDLEERSWPISADGHAVLTFEKQ
jgi:hypothetical protein